MKNRFTSFYHNHRLSKGLSSGLGIAAVLLALLINPGFLQAQGSADDRYVSDVWVSDNGDGIYTNPIIHADYSDPDVVRVGDDYYMTASNFNTVPGLPILHSKDLIDWELIGHARWLDQGQCGAVRLPPG
ncbi:MAG: family 43 glycosylhydrolase [Balneolaceae bacterium]|nr:family 43 glycosylhydrolase [Balneolaceae bacterium]